MTRTFIETIEFTKQWQALGLTDETLSILQNEIMRHPECGDMMKGTGGLRKLRIPFAGHGKSGGARVCYVDFAAYEKTYLITVFAKGEKANLSSEEKSAVRGMLKQMAEEMERYLK